MELRAAAPTDYDPIIAVADDWWGKPVTGILPRLFLDHFHRTSLLAQDDAGLAGFLIGFHSPSQPGVAYVHFLAVRPDLRRAGLARTLYARFCAAATDAGCHEVHAITAPSNDRSIAFHRGIGCTATEVADYQRPGNPMVTFRLTLPFT